MACVRRAWLTLGTLTLALENEAAGYFCTSLDLGSPESREEVGNRPDADGVIDRTRLMGGRTVTADITALSGAGARIDDVAAAFGPFMAPSARPVLHYVLDRGANTERTLTLRGSGYAWPIVGPYGRDIHLSWLAADPTARDVTVQTATAWAGSSAAAGRTYNLTFPRVYPAGGGGPPVSALCVSHGDVAVPPLLRVYGPVTGAQLEIIGAGVTSWFQFQTAFRIDAGHRVDIDCRAHSALYDGDPAQSVLNSVLWPVTWPMVAPGMTQLFMYGSSTSGVTQAQVVWQDGYLT